MVALLLLLAMVLVLGLTFHVSRIESFGPKARMIFLVVLLVVELLIAIVILQELNLLAA